jgi:hypothetical protein
MTIEWKVRPSRVADKEWFIETVVDGMWTGIDITVEFSERTHDCIAIQNKSADELLRRGYQLPTKKPKRIKVFSNYVRSIEAAKEAVIQKLIERKFDGDI